MTAEQPSSDERAWPSPGRKIHLLKRFGQRVTLCTNSAGSRPPNLTNNPFEVTCMACLKLFKKGQT